MYPSEWMERHIIYCQKSGAWHSGTVEPCLIIDQNAWGHVRLQEFGWAGGTTEKKYSLLVYDLGCHDATSSTLSL